MNYSDLKRYDPSFTLKYGTEDIVEVKTISHAHDPQDDSFIFIKNKKFLSDIGRLSSSDNFLYSGIVIESSFFDEIYRESSFKKIESRFLWIATVKDVNHSMCLLSKPFYENTYGKLNYFVDGRQMGSASISPNSQIAQGVFIGENVTIEEGVEVYPGAVILPEVTVGPDTIIYPNVTVYPYTKIGRNCRIHANTSIGTDGFGYNFINGTHLKIWHLAGVEISNDVELGSSTKIDAGAFMPTRIGEGTKADNFVQISHNAQIGKHNIFVGKSGVAGSVETGDYCIFAGGAGVAPGARNGKGCQIAAMALVSENAIVPDGSVLSGHPARPLKEWLKSQAKLRQLIK